MNKCDFPSTLVQALQNRAVAEPNKLALRFLVEEGDNAETITYAELDHRARLIAAALQADMKQGDRAILLFHSGLDYVAAFFGCLYAGVIAVPAYPPESARHQHQERLLSIIADAEPAILLTNTLLYEPLLQVTGQLSAADSSVALPKLLCVDALSDCNVDDWQGPLIQTSDIAFLQYTSGSTSTPKGVQVSHENLAVNEELIRKGFGIGPSDVIVSWLPLYHDMGLIGCLLQSIYSGILCVLMSPRYFLARPVRWLQAISKYKGTISGGPDFAYRLCSERVSASALAALDLSSWQVAFSGSEPIRQDSLDNFSDKFSACGFDKNHFFSCYGLAEATLFVTGSVRKQGISALALDTEALAKNSAELADVNTRVSSTMMGCGVSQPDHAIIIVEPSNKLPLADGKIGEIWATGASIAKGYWRNEEASAATFVEYDNRTWLRTGDLGFIRDGELFVTGRLKDMLIVRGQNLYPQDIERIIEDEIEVVRKGRVAAFAINYQGQESIGIAVEVGKRLQKMIPAEVLINSIREVVADICQEAPQQVALLNPGSLPKTSSGKLQRAACRQGIADGSIAAYAIFPAKTAEQNTQQQGDLSTADLSDKNADNTALSADIKAIWCELLQLENIAATDHFLLLGGNSVVAVQVITRCSEHLGIAIDLRLLFETPVFAKFVAAVVTLKANSKQDNNGAEQFTALTVQSREQGLPLSSAQQRLWFMWQLDTRSIAYNIPAGLQLDGEINSAALTASFKQLITRHESLRSRFIETSVEASVEPNNEQSVEKSAVQSDSQRIAHHHAVLQYSDAVVEFTIPKVDISQLSAAKRKVKLQQLHEQAAQTQFDLAAGSLLTVTLVKLAENQHQLLITMHHIIADGWSLNIMINEFAQLYAAACQGENLALILPPLTLQYADYASWQYQWLTSTAADKQLAYWQQQLAGEQPKLQLATDFPRVADAKVSATTTAPLITAARYTITLDNALTNNLRNVAQSSDASLFMLLLAAFQGLLHRYTGLNDIRVGVPSANRQRTDIQNMVGCFINTLVLRAEITSRLPFEQLLSQVKQTTLDAQMNQDIPIDKVVEAILASDSQSRTASNHDESPLFQVMFNHQQRVGASAFAQLPALSVTELPWHSRAAKCDLQLHSEEDEQGAITLSFDYATELFAIESIQGLAGHFTALLQAIVNKPTVCIGDITLVTQAEAQQLTQWSGCQVNDVEKNTATLTSPAIPSADELLADKLSQQALSTPNATALQWQTSTGSTAPAESAQLTYQQLHSKANRLAHYLQSQGVGPDVRVAILAERSPQLLIGLLAIIKAGGTYLPLDADHPAERTAYMLSDSGANVLLTEHCWLDTELFEQLTAVPQLSIIAMDQLELAQLPSEAPALNLHGDNLAYIIYTSGSTGKPKGVGITHIALKERLQWMQQSYQLSSQDVFLQKAPVSFDVSVWECFLPLITGSSLVLAAPGEQRDPHRLVQLVQQYGVTVLHFVPPLLQLFIEEPQVGQCTSLRYLFSGGEALSVTLRDRIFSQLPSVALHNRYGPTETAINVTHWHCQPSDAHRSPIGKPLANVICRVFDADLMLTPVGVPGELYIGGTGLARGYLGAAAVKHQQASHLGRAALTAERFVPDPYSSASGDNQGARLYRSGDSSRWGTDGALDYLGRIDKQIKLRGFRIEPQEIEAQLLALPGIKQATVLVYQGSADSSADAQLVAYYVLDDLNEGNKVEEQLSLDADYLNTALQKTLPSYMVPTQFIALAALPLTINGKVDVRALPAPNKTLSEHSEYVAASTPLQLQIASIWQEVLAVARIGLRDDFFLRGGHSLLATQIVARVRLQCNVEIALRVLFDHSELGDFSEQVAMLQQSGRINSMPAIELIDRSQPVPLSSSQQRLWFLWQVDPDSPAYNVGGMARLQGALQVEHFDAALQAVIQRHETLRTTFPNIDGVPMQQVAEHSSVCLQQQDFSELTNHECQQRLQQLADDEAHQPFDLEQGPLLRACLVKVSAQEHVLSLTLHHIVTEGWAMDIFARELGELYEAFIEHKDSPLMPLPVQYLDYSVWQRQWLESGEGQRQLDYWTEKLGTEHPVLALPSDRPRPVVQSYNGGLYRFAISDELSVKVQKFNAEHGLTLFMTMTAALSVLLYRYSGQNDLRIGAPIANRIRPESEGLIGAFLNTQVLRCQVDGQMTAQTLFTQVRDTVIAGQSHQDLPFEQLVDALQPPRSTAYNPLFQVMCNVQRWNFQQSRELAGMKVDYLVNDAKATKFDLNLEVTDLDDKLNCCLTYSLDLFDEARIATMARHWNNLLTAMVNKPNQRIAELALFTNEDQLPPASFAESAPLTEENKLVKANKLAEIKEQQDLCLSRLNTSSNQHQPLQYCVHELFAEQVHASPNAPALTFADKTLSYAELDAKSNRLARLLREQGVGPEDYVGLALERSLEMVIGLLAILKAGAAYVPLDPEYPIERLQDMIADSGICLLLSHSHLFAALGELPKQLKTWSVEQDGPLLENYSSAALPLINLPAQQAYLIYTSGSTGKPKGVMVTHGEISMHCQAVIERFDMRSDDCELHFYSINFDAATERLLAPLLCGSHVVLRGQNQWDAEEICQLISQHKVTTLGLTPSYGSQLAQWLSSRRQTLPIRLCITGGEVLTAEHLQRIRGAFQPELFFNAYGPTETVVMPLASLAPQQLPEQMASVPIGSLVGARVGYILDTDLAQVPQGSVGELYIGGAGLARGYHQRRGLTAERFIPNPFLTATAAEPLAPQHLKEQASEPVGRLYRTGDLVRQGLDGLVEYVGRADYQVKIRGFRIELGEIEAKLLAHPDVDETVVLALDLGSNKQLVAYVASKGQAIDANTGEDNSSNNATHNEQLISALKVSLKAQLPDYMVPTQWVVLSRLPLGPNGKLDRKALPLPDNEQNKQDFIAPSTEHEQLLASIWSEVLAVEHIGINDNFFELGGDSILSIQVVSKARQQGMNFSPRDLFQHQSIQALAIVVAQQQDDDSSGRYVAEQGLITGESALTPIQRWFFEMPVPNRDHWNQAVLLQPTQSLDADILAQALQQLVQHHDALRLIFNEKAFNEKPQWQAQHRTLTEQDNDILQTATVAGIAADSTESKQQCTQLFDRMQRSLNLQEGPLFRALLVNEELNETGNDTKQATAQRLLLVIHHLVVDGVSWRILLEDLQNSYRQLAKDKAAPLPAKTSAFSDWTERLQQYATNETQQATLAWWQTQLSGAELNSNLNTDLNFDLNSAQLPRDYPATDGNEQQQECYANTLSLRLSSKRTEQLLQQAPAAYRTQVNDLLLTALTRTLCHWTKQSSVLVQLEGHGREALFDDIDLTRTVGWFTSAYPLRLTPSSLNDEQGQAKSALNGLADDIKTIKEQLRAVPDKGLSYGLLRYLGDDNSQAAMTALPEAQITFNYLGQFDQSFGKDALFLPLSDSTGASRDEQAILPNVLSVDSQVYNNELVLRWTYSSKRFDEQTMQTLANAYLQQLESLIDHCLGDELRDSSISRLTPSDFPLAKLAQTQLDTLTVPAANIADIYPLTPMQEGLLLHTLLEPGTGIYYMQDRYRIHSAIEPQRFVKAWQAVVARHETLRASFSWNAGEEMLQVIHKPSLIDVDFLDWRQEDASQHEQRLQALLKAEREAGFDLLNSPPFHLRLICLGEQEYWFMMSNHHILIDAWCRSILMNDFFEIYTALSQERAAQLSTPPSYRDYIVWLQQQNADNSRQWWQDNLQGFEQPTPIASDRPILHEHAADNGGMVVGDCYSNISEHDSSRLQALAQNHQLTVNTFAQAAWALVLRRLSGNREVLFGVTVAGRPIDKPEMQQTVGLFINSIPLRVPTPSLGEVCSVKEWLQQLLAHNLELREHEYLSLVDIQHCSELPKGAALFDSLFVFENAPVDSSVLENARHFNASSDSGRTHTNFPLTAVCYPGDALGLHISYDQRYFDNSSIDAMLADFKRLLLALIDNFHQPLAELPLLSASEQQFLVKGCNAEAAVNTMSAVDTNVGNHAANNADSDYQGYVALFEAQVAAHPERIAASCLAQQWRYQDLNQYANCLSHTLLASSVVVDQPIALLAERGLNLLAMMIGCFKAGGAYLPLDPSHPPQRMAQMLKSSKVALLLCEQSCYQLAQDLVAQFPSEHAPKLLLWEEVQQDGIGHFPRDINNNISNPSLKSVNRFAHANSLAYVIYTSGSTGIPKGVMVEQQGMLNNQLSKIPYMQLDQNDVIAQTASQCFDISVWQFLTAPLFGGRVDIVPNEIAQNPAALLEHIKAHSITVLESVPSLIQGLLDEALREGLSLQPAMRWLLPTGEAMPPVLAEKWLNSYPDIGLINAYGPAECSDDVAFFTIDKASTASHYLPIGSPTDNNRLYLLDEGLDLVPVGAIAELCIAGMGVGRGYSYDAKRSAQMFVPDMFSDKGERLYRSGDLARRRADGVLEYVGRIDQQVKIRGYRIELGEIEAQLHKLPQISEAVVLAKNGVNGAYLVSYLTGTDNKLFASFAEHESEQGKSNNRIAAQAKADLIEQFKQSLAQVLPDYMVPLHWQLLTQLPRNANGKIDRKALPDIDFAQQQSAVYMAPSTELEHTIADIWAEILKVERVGIDDNFFELGGHSLLATQIASRLQKVLQRNIPLRAMFECNTVAALALHIDSLASNVIDKEKTDRLSDLMAELEGL